MRPGTFIDKVEVCERLGVSKQPVTAALTRLEQEGLVEIYPQRGSYVARLRLAAMSESLFMLSALATAAVARLAAAGSPALCVRLNAVLDAREEALATRDAGRCCSLALEFVGSIAHALPYSQVTHQIDVGLATVRRCSELQAPDAAALVRTQGGLRRLVAAIETHDPENAARAMHAHVAEETATLRTLAATRPELFVG